MDLTSGKLAMDARGLEGLKARARDDPKAVARDAARQFEAVFLNQMLKQMRAALPEGDPLASSATKLQTELFDQQLADKLAKRGTGLGEQIARHLERALAAQKPGSVANEAKAMALRPEAKPIALDAPRPAIALPRNAAVAMPVPARPAGADAPIASDPVKSAPGETKKDFLERMAEYAGAAADLLRVPPSFVLGQAGLESAWGAKEIRGPNGENTHNLFGIKATASWTGATVDAVTTEVVGGVARKVVQKFRAYDSYADAFRDYAKLLAGAERYAGAVGAADATSFARGLARGGYATDPAYAAKLTRTIASIDPASGSGNRVR